MRVLTHHRPARDDVGGMTDPGAGRDRAAGRQTRGPARTPRRSGGRCRCRRHPAGRGPPRCAPSTPLPLPRGRSAVQHCRARTLRTPRHGPPTPRRRRPPALRRCGPRRHGGAGGDHQRPHHRVTLGGHPRGAVRAASAADPDQWPTSPRAASMLRRRSSAALSQAPPKRCRAPGRQPSAWLTEGRLTAVRGGRRRAVGALEGIRRCGCGQRPAAHRGDHVGQPRRERVRRDCRSDCRTAHVIGTQCRPGHFGDRFGGVEEPARARAQHFRINLGDFPHDSCWQNPSRRRRGYPQLRSVGGPSPRAC